jgi:hypothetical protein
MKNPDDVKNKTYQKPGWEKQQLFERFTMACRTKICASPLRVIQLKT